MFFVKKTLNTQNHGHGIYNAKMGTVVGPKIPKMPLDFSAQFVWPSPKVLDFQKKKLSLRWIT